LNELGQRRSYLEHGLAQVQQELDSLDRDSVNTELVRAALSLGALKPYEQKELMQ